MLRSSSKQQFAMKQNIVSFRIFGDLENYTFLETLGPTEPEKQCLQFFWASYVLYVHKFKRNKHKKANINVKNLTV